MPSLADQDQQLFAFSTGKDPIKYSLNELERYYWGGLIGLSDATIEASSLSDIKWRALKQLCQQANLLYPDPIPDHYTISDLEFRWLANQLGLTPEQAASAPLSWADMWNTFADSMVGQDIVSDAVGFWDARQGAQPSGYLPNLGTGGPALDLYAAGNSGRPRVLTDSIKLPGLTTVGISTPDSNVLDITGDIEFVFRLSHDNWRPISQQTIISKGSGATEYLYQLLLTATGALQILFSSNGTTWAVNINSSVIPSVVAGQRIWLKVTRIASTGAIVAYSAPDNVIEPTGAGWTSFYTTTQATGNLFVGTQALVLGQYPGSSSSGYGWQGEICEAIVRSGVGGTEVAHFRATNIDKSTFRGTASTGEIWTVNYTTTTNDPVFLPFGGTASATDGYVTFPGVLGNYISTPDDPTLEPANSPWVLEVDVAPVSWTVDQTFVAKYGPSGQRCFTLFMSGGILCVRNSEDGSTFDGASQTTVAVPFTAGARKKLRVTVTPGAPGTCVFDYAEPGSSTYTQIGTNPTTFNGSNLFNGNLPLTIGQEAPGGNTIGFNGKMYSVRLTIAGTVRADWRAGQSVGSTGKVWTTTGSVPYTAGQAGGSTAEKYVYTPGVLSSTNRISTPNTNPLLMVAATSVTVDVRVLDPRSFYDGVGNKGVIGCRGAADGWAFFWLANTVYWSPREVSQVSLDTPSNVTTNAQYEQIRSAKWVRYIGTLSVATRVVTIQVSDDYQNWTTVISASQTGVAAGAAGIPTMPITISNYQYGGSSYQSAAQWAEVVVTVNGVKACHWRAADMNQNGGVSPITGETWTIDRHATGRKAVVVERPTFLLGTDDYFECPDNDLLDFTLNQANTMVVVYKTWSPTTFAALLAKRAGTATAAVGWYLANGNSVRYCDGVTIPAFNTNVPPSGQLLVWVVTSKRDNTANNWKSYLSDIQTTATDTGVDARSTEVLRVGRMSGAATNYADIEFMGAAVYRYLPSEDEIQQLIDFFKLPVLATPPKTTKDWIAANATLFLDPKQASQPSGYMRNLGTGGSALDAWAAGTTNRPTVTSDNGVRIYNVNPHGVSTPSNAALNTITGDIEIVARVNTIWLTASGLALAHRSPAGDLTWATQVSASGKLLFYCTNTAATYDVNGIASTAILPFTDNQTGWVKITRVQSTGAVSFYTAPDQLTEPTTWTQLGTTVTAGTTAIRSNSSTLYFGNQPDGTRPLPGVLYECIVRNGVGGTKVAHFRAKDVNPNTFKGTAPTGEVWSVNWTATTNDPVYLPFSGDKYFYDVGTANAFVKAFKSSNGNHTLIDIRVRLTDLESNNARICGVGDATQAGLIDVVVDSAATVNGRQRLWTSTFSSSGNGTQYSTYILSYPAGGWVRVVIDYTAGTFHYYHNDSTSNTEPTIWTDDGLGTGGTALVPGGMVTTPIGCLAVGANTALGASYRGGVIAKYYKANFYVDGQPFSIFDANFMTQTTGIAPTGETWTITRPTTGRKPVLVERPCWLFGTDDWQAIADNDLLDFDASIDFTLVTGVRGWPLTPNSFNAIAAKMASLNTGPGWWLGGTGAGAGNVYFRGKDASQTNIASSIFLSTSGTLYGLFVRRASGQLTATGSNTPISAALDFRNADALKIGMNAAGQIWEGEWFGLALFRRALTQAELDSVVGYFTGS